MIRVGSDIGGTFTDLVVLDEASGEIFVEKALTTPADPSIGLLEGMTALGRAVPGYAARTRRSAHATTLIANAVIERKGARAALLATRGFRDVLEMRRHVRVTTYELWADPPEPLVPRALRLPITERTWSDGRILTPVNISEIAEIAALLRREGVESVAIAFLHAYVNPHNEQEVARRLAELVPEIAITTSSSVLPQIKEYERTSACVINAYVKPLARTYLGRVDRDSRGSGSPRRCGSCCRGAAWPRPRRRASSRCDSSSPAPSPAPSSRGSTPSGWDAPSSCRSTWGALLRSRV